MRWERAIETGKREKLDCQRNRELEVEKNPCADQAENPQGRGSGVGMEGSLLRDFISFIIHSTAHISCASSSLQLILDATAIALVKQPDGDTKAMRKKVVRHGDRNGQGCS